MAFEFDCSGRRLRVSSNAAYDSKGKITSSSDDEGYWPSIIPDTLKNNFTTLRAPSRSDGAIHNCEAVNSRAQ